MNFLKRTQAIFYPERYHGWGFQCKFFEGWYYKIINADQNKAFAIIPGIAMDENGKQQAFIQVLDGKKLNAEYFKFDFTQFQSSSSKFDIQIANNHFNYSSILLNLPEFKGHLKFNNPTPWPSNWFSPGIMGPFSFVPFMECYHGILSMNHQIEGKLIYKNEEIDFTNGKGYMEKDWGHSFPEAYTWMQSNHFTDPTVALKTSVAKIPWMGNSFVGFIAGIYLNRQLIQFTTYNGSKLSKCAIDNEKVVLVIQNKKYRIEMHAKREDATSLPSPVSGFMDGKIEESMTSEIQVQLTDLKQKRIIFEDIGRNACLEVAGKISEIII